MKIGVLTISDRVVKKGYEDVAGKRVKEIIKKIGNVEEHRVVPDEEKLIREEIIRMTDKMGLDLIVTTGGTGLSKRDVTPETTLSLIEKEIPGISEIMRVQTFKYTPYSVLSRGVCGVRGESLIINLPGSPKAVKECLTLILPCLSHAVEIIRGKVSTHKIG
jgi:molybdenum cofactor synthesis domain-containing protein